MNVTALESAVLKKLLEGDLPVLEALRKQAAQCTVSKREMTGVGFFTTFAVDASVERHSGVDFEFGDVTAEIDGLQDGAGFVLFVKDGVLETLEGYSFDEPWPESVGNFSLAYLGGQNRDWELLAKRLSQGLP